MCAAWFLVLENENGSPEGGGGVPDEPALDKQM